jgi:CheY-like chemotaxis protein
MEAGFDRHLTKPVDPNVLEQLMISPAAAANAATTGGNRFKLQ